MQYVKPFNRENTDIGKYPNQSLCLKKSYLPGYWGYVLEVHSFHVVIIPPRVLYQNDTNQR